MKQTNASKQTIPDSPTFGRFSPQRGPPPHGDDDPRDSGTNEMDALQSRLDVLNGSLLDAMLLADAGVTREAAIDAVRGCSARLDDMLASAPKSHGLLHHSYIARSLRRDCDAELACLTTKVRGTRGRFRHIIGQMDVLEAGVAPSLRKTEDYSWPVAAGPLADAAGVVSVAAGIAGVCRDVEYDVIGCGSAVEQTDPAADETMPLGEAADPVVEDATPLAEVTAAAPEPADPTPASPDTVLESTSIVLEPTDDAAESAGAEESSDTDSAYSSDADSDRSLDTETVNGDEFSTAPTSPTNSHSGVMEKTEGPINHQQPNNKSEEALARGKARDGSPRSSAEHGRSRQLSLASAPDSRCADKIFDDDDDENENDKNDKHDENSNHSNNDLDRVGDLGSPLCSDRSVVSSDQQSEHVKENAGDGSNGDSAPPPSPQALKRASSAVEAFDSLISRTRKALASPRAREEPVAAERRKSFRNLAKKFMQRGKA